MTTQSQRVTRTPPPGSLSAGAGAARNAPRFAVPNPEPALSDDLLGRLRSACSAVSVSDEARAEAGRDWWPLSALWAAEATLPALPQVVVAPASTAEVSAVVVLCNEVCVPLTVFAGASGVCGGSVPLHGGVSMDMTGLSGISDVDAISQTVEARAGTFGLAFETELRDRHALTVGHWPQSIEMSTVGGWVACRGAGQYSTRYGKIEDIVVGLEVVLADGTVIRTGGAYPRSAAGPDLNELFLGSEGTLGVVTSVRMRARPIPPAERRAAWAFPEFASGLEACQRILQRGATPAVLRLYDQTESKRNFDFESGAVLVVLDEGDETLIGAVMGVVGDECAGATELGAGPVDRWFEHRNRIPDIAELVGAGLVVDTVEVAGSWRSLQAIYSESMAALRSIDGIVAASAHQSHAYSDGACLYFSFAGRPPRESAESFYDAAFDAVTFTTLANGGTLSHHHGVGVNRSRYMRRQHGASLDVMRSIKSALDRNGILNPGKLGFDL